MTQAYQDVGVPIADRLARMKQSIARLEALQFMYPDLLIKSDPMKDIYQSELIWSEVDDLEILQHHNVIKLLPYKDVNITYEDDFKFYENIYRVYTNPMEICIVGWYEDYEGNVKRSLQDGMTIIQIQPYKKRIENFLYKESLLKKIEYQLYVYLKRTILEDPKRYKIEFDENLPEKLQTLITFA